MHKGHKTRANSKKHNKTRPWKPRRMRSSSSLRPSSASCALRASNCIFSSGFSTRATSTTLKVMGRRPLRTRSLVSTSQKMRNSNRLNQYSIQHEIWLLRASLNRSSASRNSGELSGTLLMLNLLSTDAFCSAAAAGADKPVSFLMAPIIPEQRPHQAQPARAPSSPPALRRQRNFRRT